VGGGWAFRNQFTCEQPSTGGTTAAGTGGAARTPTSVLWPASSRRGAELVATLAEESCVNGGWRPSLRALFWLNKDLADSRGRNEHLSVLEPDAQQIAEIRNHLEHSYLKVHSSSNLWVPEVEHVPPDPFAYRTTEDDLRAKTLRVLKMVRALSLQIRRERCVVFSLTLKQVEHCFFGDLASLWWWAA